MLRRSEQPQDRTRARARAASPLDRWRSRPAAPAMLAMALALVAALWSLSAARQVSATAQRAVENVDRGRQVAADLARIVPPHMPVGGSQALVQRLEETLVSDGAQAKAITAVAVQSLGALSGVPSARQQARIEMTGLTLAQAAAAIDAIESSGLPCWIETLELNGSGEGSDNWSVIVQVHWLTRAVAGG